MKTKQYIHPQWWSLFQYFKVRTQETQNYIRFLYVTNIKHQKVKVWFCMKLFIFGEVKLQDNI
jgi:hypothetical protein